MESLTNSVINVHVDPKDKEEATAILKDLGLNMTTLINMTLKQVIKVNGVPFEVVNPKPSRKLRKALKEVEYMEKHPEKYKSYDNLEELFKDLNSDD